MGQKRQAKGGDTEHLFPLFLINAAKRPDDVRHLQLKSLLGAVTLRAAMTHFQGRLDGGSDDTLRLASRYGLPDFLLQNDVTVSLAIRSWLGSFYTQIPLTLGNFKSLGDVTTATALIALRNAGGDLERLNWNKNIPNQCARWILQKELAERLGAGFFETDAGSQSITDPILLGIWKAITGGSTISEGLGLRVNGSFAKQADGRWRKLIASGVASMAQPQRKPEAAKGSKNRLADRVVPTLSRRWTLIFDAFEAFRGNERIALDDFKAALCVAAAEQSVELAPIDVPSLYDAETSARSAIDLGGLKFQLVRRLR